MFLRNENNMNYNPDGKKKIDFWGNVINSVEQVGFDWFT